MRDLDELLDPVVSRRAEEDARTPEFAVVERRGLRRRRRTRGVAVATVAAVVAAVGIAGAQVASEQSDTAPAVPPGYDDPDGELAQVVRAGDAEVASMTPGEDGSMLTVWSHFAPAQGKAGLNEEFGLTLADDGETFWSPLGSSIVSGGLESATTPLPDGGFVVSTFPRGDPAPPTSHLVSPEGLRTLKIRSAPADLSNGGSDGYVIAAKGRGGSTVYVLDRATLSLRPVEQLDGVRPIWTEYLRGMVQAADGGLWLVSWRGTSLIRLANNGEVTRYPFDGAPLGLAADGGRAVVLSSGNGRSLRANVVDDGQFSSHEFWTGRKSGQISGTAILPGGRLLVNTGQTMLRSTDSSWRRADDLGIVVRPARFGAYVLQQADQKACLTPTPSSRERPKSSSETYCSTDGESWDPVALTP